MALSRQLCLSLLPKPIPPSFMGPASKMYVKSDHCLGWSISLPTGLTPSTAQTHLSQGMSQLVSLQFHSGWDKIHTSTLTHRPT